MIVMLVGLIIAAPPAPDDTVGVRMIRAGEVPVWPDDQAER